MHNAWRMRLLTVVAIAALLAGCGGGGQSPPAAPSPEAWWREFPPPPCYECCEQNVELAGPIARQGKTGLVNNNTQRRLQVWIQIPIRFECLAVHNEPQCVGTLTVTIVDEPRQFNLPTLNYDVPPVSSSVTWDYVKNAKCDGRRYNGSVNVLYDATFPGIDSIKGTLKLKLTVPDDKGDINHTWSVDIDAPGNVVKFKNDKLTKP